MRALGVCFFVLGILFYFRFWGGFFGFFFPFLFHVLGLFVLKIQASGLFLLSLDGTVAPKHGRVD